MKKELLASICLMGLAASQVANATLIVSASVGGAPSGTGYLNFNGFTPGSSASQTEGPVTVTFTPDGQVASIPNSGTYAAPYLSVGQDLLFGGTGLAGEDATPYLSTGKGSVTLEFADAQKYFGLLWGSVDTYNTLSFYDGSTFLGSITGSGVLASPNGNRGVGGTVYVNINSDIPFTKVVATSSQYAFEFDNVAYSRNNIPDGGSTLALLGGVITFLGAVRRKFQK